MDRHQLYRLVSFVFRHLTTTTFIGSEHIPPTGGFVMATNHISRLDTPVLFINPVRRDMTALVADKYMNHILFRWFTRIAEGIWIDRTKADFSAMNQALAMIRTGRPMGIAPEGTRSTTARLLEGKPGVVLLAQRAQVPIVPVGIWGTEKTQPNLIRLRRGIIHAHFGPAFNLPPLPREGRDAEIQRQTDEVMCRIAVLLPPEYRGFYADHPRLQELLAEQGA